MLGKRTISPLVIGAVVTILVVSALILSGSARQESKPIDKDNNHNYDYGHDEYEQNIVSHDEYSYEEYSNKKNDEEKI